MCTGTNQPRPREQAGTPHRKRGAFGRGVPRFSRPEAKRARAEANGIWASVVEEVRLAARVRRSAAAASAGVGFPERGEAD